MGKYDLQVWKAPFGYYRQIRKNKLYFLRMIRDARKTKGDYYFHEFATKTVGEDYISLLVKCLEATRLDKYNIVLKNGSAIKLYHSSENKGEIDGNFNRSCMRSGTHCRGVLWNTSL